MTFVNGYPDTERLTPEEKQTLLWAAAMIAPRDSKHSESISARAAKTLRDIAERFSGAEEPVPPQSLVDFLADAAKVDTSIIRRAIIEGAVTVNGRVITDPAHRLDDTTLSALFVEYAGSGYPYYP